MSEPATILPFISVPQSLISLGTTLTPTQLAKERSDFLKIARNKLKAEIFYKRSSPSLQSWKKHHFRNATICPWCGKEVFEGDMHEWLITRGDVDKAPFEWQIQIYVPCNVVICHNRCHNRLQSGEEGRKRCRDYIRKYHPDADILYWLRQISPVITIAGEKERWLWKSSESLSSQ